MGWGTIDAFVRAHGYAARPRTLGQTVGGTHVGGSKHYLGDAVDYGRNDSESDAIAQLLLPYATGPDAPLIELFGSDGTSMKNGVPLSPEPAGHAGNHTHVAIRPGATLDGFTPGASPASSATSSGATFGETSADSGDGGALALLGSGGFWLRLLEVSVGAVLILMGLVALSQALQGSAGKGLAGALSKGASA